MRRRLIARLGPRGTHAVAAIRVNSARLGTRRWRGVTRLARPVYLASKSSSVAADLQSTMTKSAHS
jgi:hypothetical protein